jgi:hypothetical protein
VLPESLHVGRSLQSGARFGVVIKDRIGHAKDRGHHRFGAVVPKIAMIFDDAGIDLDVPVRNIDIADVFDLPDGELPRPRIQNETVTGMIVQ